ncbi:MAG: hypothetical protein J2P36_19120 [Ktedonobacteraceae bacterium]|nr:hypothetical protein [Ktedonobacteraceae bacterium]
MQKNTINDDPLQVSRNAGIKQRNGLDLWYRLAAQPELPTASFRERELARKMRSSSIAILTISIIFLLFIPGSLVFPNRYVMYPQIGLIPICLFALVLNKHRRPILAGALVTISFEASLIFVCLTSWPFDTSNLQLYELFVLGEIMALTLVSPRGMILVGACNVTFIILDLLFQPHTAALNHDLHVQFAAIVIMPVSIQLMVAVVVSWYASNQLRTIQQANRAEMTAQLEHQRAEQSKKVEREKILLQQQIEQIVAVHAHTMNTHRASSIPLEPYPPLLWPLINTFNSQQIRLKRTWETEAELQRLQQAILLSVEKVTSGHPNVYQPTGTFLDSLLSALKTSRMSRL